MIPNFDGRGAFGAMGRQKYQALLMGEVYDSILLQRDALAMLPPVNALVDGRDVVHEEERSRPSMIRLAHC